MRPCMDLISKPEPSALNALRLASEVVSSYVTNNAIAASDLPSLIKATHSQFLALGNQQAVDEKPTKPAVPVKKSITDDHIICLEDGAKLKMLKRYIRTHYNLTPDEYRQRWGLPADYPMVAPAYSRRRSAYAKQFGLGKKS